MALASATGTIPFLQKGKTGRTPKFMGVYSEDVTYTSDDYVAPLVLHVIYNVDGDPVSGIKSTDYYIVFGDNYAWTGKNETLKPWEEAAKQNDDPTKRWSLFAGFSTIAAEIAFIRYGLLAGAVCCQDGDARNGYTYAKMFSQTGEDGTTNYEKFDPSLDAEDVKQMWRPQLSLDFKKGKLYAKQGIVGGWQIEKDSLSSQSGETYTTRLSPSEVFFQDEEKKRVVSLGANSFYGYEYLGQFLDNRQRYGAAATGIMVGLTETTDATAIQMTGGCVSGLALKTEIMSSSGTIGRSSNVVLLVNTNTITVTLPTMQICDEGHVVVVRRLTGAQSDSKVKIDAGYCEYLTQSGMTNVLNTGGRCCFHVYDQTPEFKPYVLESVSDGCMFVFTRVFDPITNNGVKYYGRWIMLKFPRDW